MSPDPAVSTRLDGGRRKALPVARVAVFVAALVLFPVLFPAAWLVNIGLFMLMYAGISSAWNIVGGYAGYPSLGHAAFFGIGAYAEAIVYPSTKTLTNGYVPFWVVPVIGIGVALVGLPIAAIAMRTRASVFAIVTITLLFVGQTLAVNLKDLTGGSQGAGAAAAPFGVDHFEDPFYYAMLALLLVTMAVSGYIIRSKLGLSLVAVRTDEDKGRGIGIQVAGLKLAAFSVSAGLTGMFGAVWAYYIAFIYPQFAFDPLLTVGVVLMAFLGGRATLWGPVLGAFILVPGQQYLAYELGGSRLYLVGYAGIFLVTMLLMPQGIIPTIQDRRRRTKMAARRDADLPGPEQPKGTFGPRVVPATSGIPSAGGPQR